jgi:hypothetical protein
VDSESQISALLAKVNKESELVFQGSKI